MYISLELAKNHLNIESAYTADDEYILSLIDASEKAVEVHLAKKFEDLLDEEGNLPSPLKQAILLMVGNLYQNREIVGTKTNALPYGYKYLIDLYIAYK